MTKIDHPEQDDERRREILDAEAAAVNRFTATEVEPADLFHDDSCKCPRCDPGPPIDWSSEFSYAEDTKTGVCSVCGQRSADHRADSLACDRAAIEWFTDGGDPEPTEDDGPGMTPADIAFANLDKYMVTTGVEYWKPDTDVAAVYASAAIAYELRAIRELLSAPAVFLSPDATAEGVFEARERWEREHGRSLIWPQVIKIGD
jgi:hypothetical protein